MTWWMSETQVPKNDPLTGSEEPTVGERAQHELTLCPPASWCRSCVEGRDIHEKHLRTRKERELEAQRPKIQVDNFFRRSGPHVL